MQEGQAIPMTLMTLLLMLHSRTANWGPNGSEVQLLTAETPSLLIRLFAAQEGISFLMVSVMSPCSETDQAQAIEKFGEHSPNPSACGCTTNVGDSKLAMFSGPKAVPLLPVSLLLEVPASLKLGTKRELAAGGRPEIQDANSCSSSLAWQHQKAMAQSLALTSRAGFFRRGKPRPLRACKKTPPTHACAPEQLATNVLCSSPCETAVQSHKFVAR